VDGLLDWYLFGVVLGLCVAAGVVAERTWRPRTFDVVTGLAAIAVGVAIGLYALPWWALILALLAFALVAGSLTLSVESRPAAFLVAAAVAFVPALGYLEAVAAPLLGQRLGRRAGRRYAGLRVLAKD
jgi:hypothetical protein